MSGYVSSKKNMNQNRMKDYDEFLSSDSFSSSLNRSGDRFLGKASLKPCNGYNQGACRHPDAHRLKDTLVLHCCSYCLEKENANRRHPNVKCPVRQEDEQMSRSAPGSKRDTPSNQNGGFHSAPADQDQEYNYTQGDGDKEEDDLMKICEGYNEDSCVYPDTHWRGETVLLHACSYCFKKLRTARDHTELNCPLVAEEQEDKPSDQDVDYSGPISEFGEDVQISLCKGFNTNTCIHPDTHWKDDVIILHACYNCYRRRLVRNHPATSCTLPDDPNADYENGEYERGRRRVLPGINSANGNDREKIFIKTCMGYNQGTCDHGDSHLKGDDVLMHSCSHCYAKDSTIKIHTEKSCPDFLEVLRLKELEAIREREFLPKRNARMCTRYNQEICKFKEKHCNKDGDWLYHACSHCYTKYKKIEEHTWLNCTSRNSHQKKSRNQETEMEN